MTQSTASLVQIPATLTFYTFLSFHSNLALSEDVSLYILRLAHLTFQLWFIFQNKNTAKTFLFLHSRLVRIVYLLFLWEAVTSQLNFMFPCKFSYKLS